MSMNELKAKVDQLRELRRMSEELAAEISTLEDDLKAHMTEQNTDTIHGPDFKITWKLISSSRFDSKALKAELPELWDRFSKTTTSRRFVLA